MEITKKEFERIMRNVATRQSVEKLNVAVQSLRRSDNKTHATVKDLRSSIKLVDVKLDALNDKVVRVEKNQTTMQGAQLQMQESLAAMQEILDNHTGVLNGHTIALDGISRSIVNWNAETAALRAAIKRHEEYFRVVGKKIGVDLKLNS